MVSSIPSHGLCFDDCCARTLFDVSNVSKGLVRFVLRNRIMTRQQFIAALADWIRRDNSLSREDPFNLEHASFTRTQIDSLASFCQSQNPQFNRQRWLDYVAGTHGPQERVT